MPNRTSDVPSGSGYSDNAQYRLAASRSRDVQKLINEGTWGSPEPPGFMERIVVPQYTFPAGPSSVPRSSASISSSTSSMALAAPSVSVAYRTKQASYPAYTSSYASGSDSVGPYTPSLVSGYSVPSDASSLRTKRTDSVVENSFPTLDEDGNVQTASRKVECPFAFLNCTRSFEDMDDWETHCKSHFRGRLPRSLECPFGCGWSITADSSSEAWEEYSVHVNRSRHSGHSITRRPSPALIQQLVNAGAITPAQQKELRLYGRLTGGGYLEPGGVTAERRRERRQQ